MNEKTPFFKGFHRFFNGPRRRSEKERMIAERRALEQSSLCQLSELFASWIDPEILAPTESGDNSRQRDYSIAVTFWAFLIQVITPHCACREIVRKVQGWYAAREMALPGASTSAYCQARQRLSLEKLRDMHHYTASEVERHVSSNELWLGRTVKVIDGTGVSMPDTPENQKVWPQPSGQKKGCGFPVAKLVGCFSLASGTLIDWVEGNLHQNEQRLCKELYHLFERDDVLLADQGFCSYALIGTMINQSANCVIRLNSKVRKTDWRHGKKLSKNERLVVWEKPRQCPKTWKKRQWNRLPDTMTLRLVKISVDIPGFRPETLYFVTTFTDPDEVTAEDLAKLYLKRWRVELYFRDIKIAINMDVLRCKTPDMVRKEITMHAIAYNLIRAIMQRASCDNGTALERLSFKGTVDTIRQWSEVLNQARGKSRAQAKLIANILQIIAVDQVPDRPNRIEPRAKKRRPKAYPLLTKPRHEIIAALCGNPARAGVMSRA